MTQLTGEEPFVDMFCYAAGESEVPKTYFQWAALSLLASCVENRVWMERIAYKRIFPNLYVFLIGRSGAGKGQAIGLAQKVIQTMDYDGRGVPPVYRGSLTRAAFHDEMATAEGAESSPLYFMCPELGDSIGSGQNAKDLIKFMTDIWEGDIPYHQERTRTSGKRVLKDPCLNCLAGTTPDWCNEVIELKDLKGGFWARVFCVLGERDYSKRIYEPDTSGWLEAAQWLSWRLSLLLGKGCENDLELRGQMHLSPEAKAMDKEWYMTRPEVGDLIEAHWARQQDMIWKVAMLLKLGDYYDLRDILQGDESWKEIGVQHLHAAQVLCEETMHNAERYATHAMAYHYNASGTHVEAILRKEKEIFQSPQLLQKASRYGLRAKELNKIIEDLEDMGKVQRHFLGQGKIKVVWVG